MSDSTSLDHYPIMIIGSGIAGLSAAIYAGRGGNDPLVIRGDEPGGQLTLTTDVANYPGFPEGVGGHELIQKMTSQAEQFGAEFTDGVVRHIEDTEESFRVELTDGDSYTSDAVIAASGASARTLGIPGEDELMGYGVSTCATCDGAFFQGEDMIVVGGGDAAFEEAHFLTEFANTVHIIHRREEFRAEEHWQDKVMEKVENEDIEIIRNTELIEIDGTQENGIKQANLVTHPDGYPTDRLDDSDTEKWNLDVGAVFVAIGHTPNTSYLDETAVELDETGYIKTEGGPGGGTTETDVDGIFGAGDVVDYHYQQAVTAAGMGVQAALDADSYLD